MLRARPCHTPCFPNQQNWPAASTGPVAERGDAVFPRVPSQPFPSSRLGPCPCSRSLAGLCFPWPQPYRQPPLALGCRGDALGLGLPRFSPCRYYATVHPLKKRISVTSCISVVGGIWLLSCGLVAPAIAHTYHVEFRQEGFAICEEFWMEKETQRLAYAYGTLIVTYILPLSAVSLSYICISVKLRNRVVPGHPTQSQAEFDRLRKRKIFRLIVLVVAAFGVCWLPIHVFNIIRDIDINLINKHYFLLIQLLCHWFAMSSSCCNPFLYAWLHDRFRGELRKMFTCKRKTIPAKNCGAAGGVL